MARRAVQGYTEKSYYENTRFLGMLATNDPLQEGYFKHLVNFDISDTGQSLKPRRGFLTTMGKYDVDYTDYEAGVAHSVGDYIMFNSDLYVVTTAILAGANTSFFDLDTVKLYDNFEQGALVPFGVRALIFKEHSIQSHIVYDFDQDRAFVVDISGHNVDHEDHLIPIHEVYMNLDFTNVEEYIIENVPLIAAYKDDNSATNAACMEYFKDIVLLHTTTQVNSLTDLNGVRKNIIRIQIHDPNYEDGNGDYHDAVNLSLAFYYRKNEVTIVDPALPGNTLVFEILDLNEHPSYLINERNIASSKSIIPDPLQIEYTEANRPDGTISTLGLLYASNADMSKYYIQYIPKGYFRIRPHFILDDPALVLNEDTEVCNWAYRIDISSISGDYPVIKGNWMRYDPEHPGPERVFPRPTGYESAVDDDRHYEGTRYVLTAVPADFDVTLDYTGVFGSAPEPTSSEWSKIDTAYVAWRDALNPDTPIESVKDLKERLENLLKKSDRSQPLFYIRDLHEDEILMRHDWKFRDTDDYYFIYDEADDVVEEYTEENYKKPFWTLQDIIDKLDDGSFASYDFTFRLLPVAYYLNYTGASANDSRWAFYDINRYNHIAPNEDEGEGVCHIVIYDKFNNLVDKPKFEHYVNGEYQVEFNEADLVHDGMPSDSDIYKDGFNVTVYLRPYAADEIADAETTLHERNNLKVTWTGGAVYVHSQTFIYGLDSLQNIELPQFQQDDPENILGAENFINFDDLYTVAWNNNIVYVSELGQFNYFKEVNRFTYSEKVVKVVEFKNILLVFTTQHLYAIYPETIEGTQEVEGEQVTVTSQVWVTQKVLYNLRTDAKYADAIQVFNEFILYYSADGQLFLIKPNTMINSETRFGIKYFNQGANDILLNYDDYINERLSNYNRVERVEKDEVEIKALVSVNYIKIFYYVPGLITYILVFDVINNRFFVYDTIVFSDIRDKLFIESGELYITEQDNMIYFTFPYTEPYAMDSNVDMSVTNNFRKVGISNLIDTGNLNLNNHLKKRFLKLHTVFKNLSTSKLLYNVETLLDDIISHPFYDTQLEVHDIGGTSYFVSVPKTNNNDLIDLVGDNQISEAGSKAFKYAIDYGTVDEDSLLFDFAEFTSSKLLTHRSSILGRGKVFRLKMQFISKGDFKIQTFGVVYKERRI